MIGYSYLIHSPKRKALGTETVVNYGKKHLESLNYWIPYHLKFWEWWEMGILKVCALRVLKITQVDKSLYFIHPISFNYYVNVGNVYFKSVTISSLLWFHFSVHLKIRKLEKESRVINYWGNVGWRQPTQLSKSPLHPHP